MNATPLPADPGKYARRARSIYGRALQNYATGAATDRGCFACALPQRVGRVDLSRPASRRGTCPLPHHITIALAAAVLAHRGAKEWEIEAVARRVWRLFEDDYRAPPPDWTPLADDPHAWALDGDAQAGIDDWLGRGQGSN